MALRLYNVEQAIQSYIATLLPGSTGYVGELPRAAISETPRMWMFAMDGGSEVIQVRQSEDTFAHTMDATVRGIYTDREQAQDDLWTLMSGLPWGAAEIPEVQRISQESEPNIQRSVVQLENDLTEGGDVRVWAIEIRLAVTFESE